MKSAAIYARVSSDRQKEENTIASQTAALVVFAREQDFNVPDEWVFEDEGYSGADLARPGLERVRDLAADGQIQAVLVHSPDRLSRKYAYQVLLAEELARHGVDLVFIKAPHSGTPEDQLMVQFQGMIAEYERAQILERSRRGKRHRARAGEISVLSGAPYGYRYVRRQDAEPARYDIVASEAAVVQSVFEQYTIHGFSIGSLVRYLNQNGTPTRKNSPRWERSVIWAMLRNPAYKGVACFGRTQVGPRQRTTRPSRSSAYRRCGETGAHERPRTDWIEVPVPPLVGEDTFALAQERLADNKRFAPRRTIEPSIAQGLVSCRKCGYALARTSTKTSSRKIHYYRCIGSDGWRHAGGPVCDSRPIRQDLLDAVVWQEVVHLLENPALISEELDRRLLTATTSEPTKRRKESLERDLARVVKSINRLLTAYQEDLLSLDELRQRMPELRGREQAMQTELRSIIDQEKDRMVFLRLAETLTAFLAKLKASAETLDVIERQKIVRLLVQEVLVDDGAITIRHSIPLPRSAPPDGDPPIPDGGSHRNSGDCLLRSGREDTALGRAGPAVTSAAHAPRPAAVPLLNRHLEPQPDQVQHVPVDDATGHRSEEIVVRDRVEISR